MDIHPLLADICPGGSLALPIIAQGDLLSQNYNHLHQPAKQGQTRL
jgi:hypothetical protein